MANFKEKLKQIFSNKLVKAIGIIFMCIIGFVLLGRCNKVNAANFILNDGTISEITYNENQILKGIDNNGVEYTSLIKSPDGVTFYLVYLSESQMSIFTNCTYNDLNFLSCYRDNNGTFDSNSAFTGTTWYVPPAFEIGTNTVTYYNNAFNKTLINTLTISPDYDSGYADGYNAGYSAGIGDNQQNIYNNGYNAGETAGYNAGYSQGETNGYQTGFNEGASEGYDDGKTDGYNEGYTAGQNSVDITIDNQEYANNYIQNNNYHSDHDYMNYGSIKYDEGYTAGYEIAEDEAAFIVINPYEEGTENYDKWGQGISDAYYCYFENGAVLNECYDDSNSDFAAYEEGFGKFVSILQNEKNKLDNIIDLTNRIVLVSYEEGQNSGYESGKKIGYEQALKDEEAFLGFIPATLGGVVANFMPILTYEVYGISIMNLIGLIAMIGIAIIIVKFIVG